MNRVIAWKGCIGQIGDCECTLVAISVCICSSRPALLHQLACLEMVTWTIPGQWELKVSGFCRCMSGGMWKWLCHPCSDCGSIMVSLGPPCKMHTNTQQEGVSGLGTMPAGLGQNGQGQILPMENGYMQICLSSGSLDGVWCSWWD